MATESRDQEFETKFIGEACVTLDRGLLPPYFEVPGLLSPYLEVPVGESSGENRGKNIVERVYRASLFLKDYFANILIALIVQMTFARNKVNGSSKIITKIVECDNNGIRNVVPQQDKGVSCKCRNGADSRCSMHSVCKGRCPNAVYQQNDGVPIIPEYAEEKMLEDNQPIMEWINKKRAKRAEDTRTICSWYQRILTEEFGPLFHGLIRAQKLSLSRLKRWITTMRPNLRSLYQEQDVEVVLRSFYPPWYDTIWLSELIEKLEQHLGINLEIKQSMFKFNRGVDQYFSKRAFVKGGDSFGKPVAMISVDHEWQYFPAHDFHLIYGRAASALEQVSDCGFKVLFCTVLKEYVVEHKINSAIIKFKEAVVKDIERDGRFESSDETEFTSLKEACSDNIGASVLVVGKELGIAIPDLKEGCSCAQLEAHLKFEQGTLAACCKPFCGCYGQ